MKPSKHLITSGCSFTGTRDNLWPWWLSRETDSILHNRGYPAAGNGWISRSAIYQTQSLLDSKVPPEGIVVIVMWSGIDRKELFISNTETKDFSNFSRYNTMRFPINFINSEPNNPNIKDSSSGYIENFFQFNTSLLPSGTSLHPLKFLSYFADESLAIQSYEHFLRLQWYCNSKNVTLINLTYADIMHYPDSKFQENHHSTSLTKDRFKNVVHLHNMIDFNKWIFYKDTEGLYEYVRDNKLTFRTDGVHPSIESNKHFVENFLLPKLQDLNIFN